MFPFKYLRGKLARGRQKMYLFAHARRLTAVLPAHCFTIGCSSITQCAYALPNHT